LPELGPILPWSLFYPFGWTYFTHTPCCLFYPCCLPRASAENFSRGRGANRKKTEN